MPDYEWSPITPLSEEDRTIDLSEVQPLYESWKATKQRLKGASLRGLDEFNRRLVRRLSIETGIIEHLYELDEGTTEALVTHGFAENLVAHSSTDIEPARLIDILRDQEAAIQLVMDCVATNRALSKGLIHELQAILTRHQTSTDAVDTLGHHLEIPLLKGAYKRQPNNPRRSDGSMHEYCPPVHVESEMDNLLKWYSEYEHEDPLLVSAWLHHRFTQIHPYQDGNGRVSRALVTLVLSKAGLLPLVIDRKLRTSYIKDLERADRGSLRGLVQTFSRLEKNAILQGLSVDAEEDIAQHEALTSTVIQNLADKFRKRREQHSTELRRVNDVAINLRAASVEFLTNSTNEFRESIREVERVMPQVLSGGSDAGNGYWYRFEVVQSAKSVDKFANFDENHYFVKSSLRMRHERLVFVLSFHHVGRELSGIMEATAFAQLESLDNSEEGAKTSERFVPCSLDPFAFSRTTKVSEVTPAFHRWLDSAFAIALREFSDRL